MEWLSENMSKSKTIRVILMTTPPPNEAEFLTEEDANAPNKTIPSMPAGYYLPIFPAGYFLPDICPTMSNLYTSSQESGVGGLTPSRPLEDTKDKTSLKSNGSTSDHQPVSRTLLAIAYAPKPMETHTFIKEDEQKVAHEQVAHSTQQQLETVNEQLRQERVLRQNKQKEFKQQLQKQQEELHNKRHEKECAEFKQREELHNKQLMYAKRITYTLKESFMASPWQDVEFAECMAERRQYAKEIANSPWLDAQTKDMLAPPALSIESMADRHLHMDGSRQIDARDQNMPALERVCTVRTPKKQEYETQPQRMKLKHKRKLSSRPTASQ